MVCNVINCFGYEVDFVYFEINKVIFGCLYGENIVDSVNGIGRDRCDLLIIFVNYLFQ